jgi:hypothetical protein
MESDQARRHCSGIDHISGLPDELLHEILLRLDRTTPAAAARTSILSRRCRHVWASLPDLFFDGSHEYPVTNYSLATIDAALAAYSAPKVSSLNITTAPIDNELRVPAKVLVTARNFEIYHGYRIFRFPSVNGHFERKKSFFLNVLNSNA